MNTELHSEEKVQDVSFGGLCIGCGGTVQARFTPGSACGVCVTCRLLTPIVLVPNPGGGVRPVQWPSRA